MNDSTSGERIEGILTFLWNEADIPDIVALSMMTTRSLPCNSA